MNDVTQVLSAIEAGDSRAAEQLLPLVYDELRKLAASRMAHEQPGQTLSATALVHEAWLRLVPPGREIRWDGRGHFFAAAAEAMRRILIDRARHRNSLKAGGGQPRLDVNEVDVAEPENEVDLLALDEALQKLERKHPRKAQLVKLRYFAGLTVSEAAATLGISVSTAENDWAYARGWLKLELDGMGEAG
jgi:RNA polymerase sigma factor (TIGR02999 family)